MEGVTTPHYADPGRATGGADAIIGDEIGALVSDGVPYIQIDARATLAMPTQLSERVVLGGRRPGRISRPRHRGRQCHVGWIPRDSGGGGASVPRQLAQSLDF